MEKIDMPPSVLVEKTKIGDPAPLGLAGFALTTFILSAHNAGWAPDLIWITLGLFYGGTAQFVAGMWEYTKNNTFGATAFATYGAFWLSLALFVLLFVLPQAPFYAPELDVMDALGWFLAGFFIFNTYMMLCALQINHATFLVFFLLDLTELCLFIGNFKGQPAGQSASWTMAGGYLGVFTAAAAFYTSFAVCFNSLAGRQIIFVGKPILDLRGN